MEIPCRFIEFSYRHGKEPYGCWIKDQEISEDAEFKLNGQHLEGKSNNDVLSIQFDNCTLPKTPQGLTKIFPNLAILEIDNSKLTEISKYDLVEYKNLRKFICTRNELEFLPGNLFEGFENLEFISFWGNNLKLIEPDILDGFDKLNHANFRNNPNYSKCYSIYQVYDSNATLEEVKVELMEKFPTVLKNLRKSEENLKQENQLLRDSEAKLREKIHELKNSRVNINQQPDQLWDEESKCNQLLQKEITEDLILRIFVLLLLFYTLRN